MHTLNSLMGNKIARHTECIDERYTRPQGSYEYQGDFRKLRRLILNGQLAPCYPGAEEYSPELDECPICFLFFPSLNRSKCCSKCLCTECYLQIKSSGFTLSIHCPFCKTSNYMVEYRGARTAKEKAFEQAEEQKVIEAKIRTYQKELHDEKQRLVRGEEDTLADELTLGSAREHVLHAHNYNSQQLDRFQEPFEHDDIQLFGQHDSEDEWCLQETYPHSSREDEIGLDMDEVMLMRAIWLSIRDQGEGSQESSLAQQNVSSDTMNGFGLRSRIKGRHSGSDGVAETRDRVASGSQTACQRLCDNRILMDVTSVKSGNSQTRSGAIGIPERLPGASRSSVENEEATWGMHHTRKSYPQTETQNYEEIDGLANTMAPMTPETFDEQIMLAMALSLADAEEQAR